MVSIVNLTYRVALQEKNKNSRWEDEIVLIRSRSWKIATLRTWDDLIRRSWVVNCAMQKNRNFIFIGAANPATRKHVCRFQLEMSATNADIEIPDGIKAIKCKLQNKGAEGKKNNYLKLNGNSRTYFILFLTISIFFPPFFPFFFTSVFSFVSITIVRILYTSFCFDYLLAWIQPFRAWKCIFSNSAVKYNAMQCGISLVCCIARLTTCVPGTPTQ